ncbi:hypothetical protein BKA62DRAFT_692261 [Auriculariales sp. MPI-PUGE-AT-0066]|nr:hypothetical protein BKA62DRAFT_692261 [Auriculariales sp. MPI-PUGE-AT-0066]
MAAGGVSKLPTELLGIVLSSLTRRELIEISPVCRVWRQAATRLDSRFYLEAGYSQHLFADRQVHLQRILDASQHALDWGFKLRLWFSMHTGEWDDNNSVHEIERALPLFEEFCNVLERTLHILLDLMIFVPESWQPPLSGSAPYLRGLEFGRVYQTQLGRVIPQLPPAPVPRTLLNADAPRLRVLQLDDAAPGDVPQPVFAQVVELGLVYTDNSSIPSMCLADHFPALKHLRIVLWEEASNAEEAVPLRLGDLTLDRLDVEDRADAFFPHFLGTEHVMTIPSIICRTTEQHINGGFLTSCIAGDDALRLQLACVNAPSFDENDHNEGGIVLVVSTMDEQRPRTRVYVGDVDDVHLFHLFNFNPQLGERLVIIQLELFFAKSLSDVGVSLPKLSTIDFWLRHDWVYWDDVPGVRYTIGAEDEIGRRHFAFIELLTLPSLSVLRFTALGSRRSVMRHYVFELSARFATVQPRSLRLELAGVDLIGPDTSHDQTVLEIVELDYFISTEDQLGVLYDETDGVQVFGADR